MDVIDDESVNPGIKPHGHRRHQAVPATHLLVWPIASGGGVLGQHSNLLEPHPARVIVVTGKPTSPKAVKRHPPRNLPAPFNMSTHRQVKTEVTYKMKP
jgi:hypothetical protein